MPPLTRSSSRVLWLFLYYVIKASQSFCILQHRCSLRSSRNSLVRFFIKEKTKKDGDAHGDDDFELVVSLRVVGKEDRRRQQRPSLSSKSQATHRRILQTIRSRYSNYTNDDADWTTLRNYLYRSADKLTVTQVEQVCNYLNRTFDQDTQKLVLQTTPRILRKTVATNLEPVVNMLRGLYGDDLMQQAIRRNPTLLLTRGVGYNVDTLDLVSVYLQTYLPLSDTSLNKLQTTAPKMFQVPLSKLLSNLSFLRELLMTTLTESEVQTTLVKLITLYPALLGLSEENLRSHAQYLKDACHLHEDGDAARFIQRNPAVLGLSVESNLQPTIDFLSRWLNHKPEDLRKCIVMHPPILSLSLGNLRSKVAYLSSFDQTNSTTTTTTTAVRPLLSTTNTSLVARILCRAPAVYSLSLESIQTKVDFLSRVWGINSSGGATIRRMVNSNNVNNSVSLLSSLLSEDPSILTLSLEGNLRPTVHFFNRTGYIHLDDEWRLVVVKNDDDNDNDKNGQPTLSSSMLLRPRCLAASLYQRLLPRWHFALDRNHLNNSSSNTTTTTTTANNNNHKPILLLPLHVLASATDVSFCKYMQCDLAEYREFQQQAIPRLKFSSQFDVWLKTGRPLDV